MSDDSIELKCPSCSATITFDAGTQDFKCPFCDSVFSIDDLISVKETLVNINDVSGSDEAGQEWTSQDGVMSEYHCNSCGGDIYTDENTSATMCPYCGSSVVLKGRLSGTLKPDLIIPFKKTKEQALDILQKFCSGKRLLPKNFFEDSRLEETKGLYVPYWIYDMGLDASIDFLGVDETMVEINETKRVTERYYDVKREGTIAFDDIPVDGSKKMPDDLMESIEPFDSKDLVEFQTPYLSGFVADKYDVDRDVAKQRAIVRAQDEVVSSFKDTVHYNRVTVTNTDIDISSMNSNYVLYPVWLFTTVWNEQKFTFAMNGQTGKMAGDLPVDKGHAVFWFALTWLVTTLVSGLAISFFGDIFDSVMFGSIIGIVVAVIVLAALHAGMHTVSYSNGASEYIREGSLNITDSKDEFLYKRTYIR